MELKFYNYRCVVATRAITGELVGAASIHFTALAGPVIQGKLALKK